MSGPVVLLAPGDTVNLLPPFAAAMGLPRRVDSVRTVTPGHNPAQTDRSNQVLPFDPEAHDPFLMWAEDWFSNTGFDWHPHRGFETVTYVVDGVLEHRDNAGGHGVLHPGDVQWTTTGRGVLHTEIAHERKGVHTLQLWLNLPRDKKMVEPRYQDLRAAKAPLLPAENGEVRLFAGTVNGVRGPARTYVPTTAITARLDRRGSFVHEIPGEHSAILYVLEGDIAVGADHEGVSAGHTAWFHAGEPGSSQVPITAETPSHVIMFSSQPIGEPVVTHGPFVMNTREEVVQAVRDFQSGLFGAIPASR